MATLTVWTDFTKRSNSTKQPTGGVAIEVKLKENCSMVTPTFICNNIGLATYCQYGSTYYYVTETIFVTNTVVELRCVKDPLATYKSQIGSYNCFIERAQTGYNVNDMLTDTYASQKNKYIRSLHSETNLTWAGATFDDDGWYVLSVLGNNGDSLNYFVCTPYQFGEFLAYINDDTNFEELNGINDPDLQNSMKLTFNANKYLVGCSWTPCRPTGLSGEEIYVGKWNTHKSGMILNQRTATYNTDIAIPAFYYNDWRDYNPSFTKLTVRLPGAGTIDVDPKYINKANPVVHAVYEVDWITGGFIALLRSSAGMEIGRLSGTLYSPVQIGSTYTNNQGIQNATMAQAQAHANNWKAIGSMVAGTVTTIIAVGSMLATGGITAPLAMGAIGGLGAVGGGLLASQTASQAETTANMQRLNCEEVPESWVNGSNGSQAEFVEDRSIRVHLKQVESTDLPITTCGYPIYKNGTISNYSGFVKCVNASPPLNCNTSDRDYIIKCLNGGFYYE